MKAEDGIIILPSRGRAKEKLPRCLAAMKETGTVTPGVIMVGRDDYEANESDYAALDLPDDWRIVLGNYPDTAAATNAGYAICGDASHVIWMTDDNIAETPLWDQRIAEALTGVNFVSTAFGEKSKRLNGAIGWSRELLDAVGYIYPPTLKHLFLDDLFEEIGRMTGCWQVLPEVMVRHFHGPKVGEPDATSDRVNTFWEADRRGYIEWQKTDGIPAVERIFELMRARGFDVKMNDFRGVDLCILVPNGSGAARHEFVSSLNNTISFVKQFGGQASVIELPGCSDIALARNRLMARFMDTDATHCLCLDTDMEWEVGVIGELIRANKDVVAIAGRMKRDEVMFCARCQDDHGRQLPIRVDPATGFLEVTAVGFACVLIKREVCVRMAQHYADLTYVTASGEIEVGVFEPMILNRRRYSEDFAWSWRWRAIGGKIFVGAHLPIGHIGTQTYGGSWADALTAQSVTERPAA